MAGQLRVDEITDEAGTGAPSFPNGIPPASLGTGSPDNTNFLRGDGEWQSPAGQLQLLQEDTFTTSGTWTKATGYDADDTVFMLISGGGSSGGAVRVSTGAGAATGGASGAGRFVWGRYADFPASLDLTVGAGGAAVTRTTAGASNGNSGGTTTVSSGGITVVTAGSGEVGFGGTVAVSGASTSIQGSAISALGVVAGQYFSVAEASFVADPADGFGDPTAGFIRSVAGSAARQGATNRTKFNPVIPRTFTISGAGSGTANGQDAIGIGGGGGGCVRQDANAISGAGAAGGLLVRYYRGAAPILAILNGA
jgi:hypothetical protein